MNDDRETLGLVEVCIRHPDRAAVERCEVCRRPVCGSCLWYANSGERLCPEDAAIWRAAGRPISPPERYAAGISPSEASAILTTPDRAPYHGNSTDVGALLATVVGLLGLASCFGAAYVIPFAAFALGLVGWLHAKDAISPSRTRWLSGIGMASGGVFILAGFAFVTLCALCFVLSVAIPSTRGPTLVSPNPFVIPTP